MSTIERVPSLDEQETTFTIEATDRKTLYVFSNDSVWWGRIEKLGIEPFRRNGYGRWYKVSLADFGFGIRKKPQMTDEQRAARSERMTLMRAEQLSDDDDDDDDDV